MIFFASDAFGLTLPEGHRFPAEKYALLRKELLATDVLTEEQIAPGLEGAYGGALAALKKLLEG